MESREPTRTQQAPAQSDVSPDWLAANCANALVQGFMDGANLSVDQHITLCCHQSSPKAVRRRVRISVTTGMEPESVGLNRVARLPTGECQLAG